MLYRISLYQRTCRLHLWLKMTQFDVRRTEPAVDTMEEDI